MTSNTLKSAQYPSIIFPFDMAVDTVLSDLLFSLRITSPIFVIIGLGYLLKKISWINSSFAQMGSTLVFRVTLPCMLFVKLSRIDFTHGLPLTLVAYGATATIVIFLILDVFATRLITNEQDKGVFVQGAYRGNLGIIGLAFCLSAFGDSVLGAASIYLAILTMLYNVLAVITLTRHLHNGETKGMAGFLFQIVKNPLILSILAGITVSMLAIPIPDIALQTGGYLASMTLPLALLCAGASIRLQDFQSSPTLYWSSAMKLFFVPLAITTGGILIGLRGEQLGVLYLMSASPTAAASHPMTQAMKGNHYLAAAIIAVTSAGSLFFTTIGIFLLKVPGLI